MVQKSWPGNFFFNQFSSLRSFQRQPKPAGNSNDQAKMISLHQTRLGSSRLNKLVDTGGFDRRRICLSSKGCNTAAAITSYLFKDLVGFVNSARKCHLGHFQVCWQKSRSYSRLNQEFAKGCGLWLPTERDNFLMYFIYTHQNATFVCKDKIYVQRLSPPCNSGQKI